jgi:endonuclease/exonuclease/phosphatase family metal-dependent hydrolase
MSLADLPSGGVRDDGSAVVRLLSYNIRSLRDDRAALARVIRACDPDVVCIQEAPRFFRWREKSRDLAAACGLLWVAGGRPATGPMVLTNLRPKLLRSEEVLLPRTPGLHERGFAIAHLRVGRARFAVLSAHLSLNRAERFDQTGMLLDQVDGFEEGYAVAAGDINERPDGKGWQRLAGRLQDGWAVAPWGEENTSQAATPVQRIDGVFASAGITVLGCGVPVGLPGVTDADLVAATDHRPVLSALHIPAED